MAAWVWVVIAIAVVVVVALVAVVARNRRTTMLRDRFGPEYDRVLDKSGDQRAAEADLRERERERARFELKPLPEATRLGFASEWRDLQERFIDEPAGAAGAADTLITRVMEARGYPMKDFDGQAELLSVDHPETVENYRFAHAVRERALTQQASTEDLREALLRYRSLFDELLSPEANGAADTTADDIEPVSRDSRRRVTTEPEAPAPVASATGQAYEPADAEAGRADAAAPDTEYDNQTIEEETYRERR
jgi:hypothetical protein